MMRIGLSAYIGNGNGAHGFSPGMARGKVDYENLSQTAKNNKFCNACAVFHNIDTLTFEVFFGFGA
jgi:hypothetical protein